MEMEIILYTYSIKFCFINVTYSVITRDWIKTSCCSPKNIYYFTVYLIYVAQKYSAKGKHSATGIIEKVVVFNFL